MAFSVLSSTSKQSTNATSVTTNAINTSGADQIIIVLDCELLASGSLPTDSQSNTWTPLTKYNNGARTVRAFICLGPTTNASHTFSFSTTGSETQPTLHVMAVSGAQQSGQPDKSATSSNNQLPSTTPSSNNELVITYICTRNTPPLGGPSGGYTVAGTLFDSTTNADGGALYYLIQTTATATAPLWGANDANRVTGLNSFFASTATNISVPVATMAITTYAPAVAIDNPIPAGALVLTEYAPSITVGIAVPVGTLTIAGYAPAVAIDNPIPVGALVITGYAPSISGDIEIPAGTLAFTTYAPNLLSQINIEVPVGSLSITGLVPAFTLIIPVGVGSLVTATYEPFTDVLNVHVPLATIGITTYAPSSLIPTVISIPVGALHFTTFAPTVSHVDITACAERFGPKLYYWEPSYLLRPEDTFLRATDWENAGHQGMKFVQGIIIEADTEGETRQIKLQGDQADIETITINHNGQIMKPYSLNQPVQKHLLRLLPVDLTAHWRLFNFRWVYEPAPEYAKEWKTQGTDHDIPGYQFLKDGYIAHASTADITLNITVDDNVFTYVIPNSGGVYVKTYILFAIANSGLTLKGSLFTYELTSAAPFQLFQKDCEVRVHAWAGGAYMVKLPFGDVHRTAGARI